MGVCVCVWGGGGLIHSCVQVLKRGSCSVLVCSHRGKRGVCGWVGGWPVGN